MVRVSENGKWKGKACGIKDLVFHHPVHLISRELGVRFVLAEENFDRFDVQGATRGCHGGTDEGKHGRHAWKKKSGSTTKERVHPCLAMVWLTNRGLGGPVPTVWESRTVPAAVQPCGVLIPFSRFSSQESPGLRGRW